MQSEDDSFFGYEEHFSQFLEEYCESVAAAGDLHQQTFQDEHGPTAFFDKIMGSPRMEPSTDLSTDLSGLWYDFHGVTFELKQTGHFLDLVGRNHLKVVVTHGHGRLMDDQLHLNLHYADGSWGQATLVILDGESRLGGTATNLLKGTSYGFMLQR